MLKILTVDASCEIEEGSRLDYFISQQLSAFSRSYIKKLITEGRVSIDGTPAKASEKVRQGMQIEVDVPPAVTMDIEPEQITLDVVYEDDWLIVINKPQGMVVHPAAGHHRGTLVNALLHHCEGRLSDLNGVIRPGIIHRIDKDTSGLLLVVKDNQVHAAMAEQIRSHTMTRLYQAVVYGMIEAEEGIIEAPVGRDPRHRQRMAVVASGKPAVTRFKVLKRLHDATYIEARLESGRTHQIRVHCKYIKHPVIGDPLYAPGRKTYNLSGQALHAGMLVFEHPVEKRQMTLTAPLPSYFTDLLGQLE